jgi:hypothetical protein
MLIGAESGVYYEREAAEEKVLSEAERDLLSRSPFDHLDPPRRRAIFRGPIVKPREPSHSSNISRIACGRDGLGLGWAAIHASSELSVGGCSRSNIARPRPVVFGRPRFFGIS